MSIPDRENFAFWLNKDGSLSLRELVVPGPPKEGEVLVRVLYSGVNPADTKHVTLGVHDTVAGYDFCGEVVQAGPNSPFAVGDVIAGATLTKIGRPLFLGAHQNYLIYQADGTAFKVPKNMPLYAAACMGVVVRTAADVFFNLLRYPLISEKTPNPPGALLIWGGTTSIGLSVLQFARAKHVTSIIVVAPPEQFKLLEALGADYCFDYNAPNVIDDIKDCARKLGEPILNVLDAVGSHEAKTAEMAAACGANNANVATMTVHPKYQMPFCQMHVDTTLDVDGFGKITIPKRPKDAERASEAFLWAIEHYGNGFEFPRITVSTGLSPIALDVVTGHSEGNSLGKRVIAHPIR
ncbi:MAG: zinc-binding dehydrogenase [Roseomonas mucosa]|nr:zinc-binding dehydrogenase [Roseomonas mucosa]